MKQQKNILMGVISYIGPLIIISYLLAKDDPFVKFHIKQALTIIVVSVILTSLKMFLVFPLGIFFGMMKLFLGIFVLIGILNALLGKKRELPIIGRLAESFNF